MIFQRLLNAIGFFGALLIFQDFLQFNHEFVYVLERAIHGGEPDVGHIVQFVQFLDDFLANVDGGNFLFA